MYAITVSSMVHYNNVGPTLDIPRLYKVCRFSTRLQGYKAWRCEDI